MSEIELTKGYKTIVDSFNFDELNKYSWSAVVNSKNRNKIRVIPRARIGGKIVMMHRFIMGVCDLNIEVDHIDGNTLNNTLKNLRLATPSQNAANKEKTTYIYSKYKGVTWGARQNKWRAMCKHKHIGYFKDEIDAAKAYDKIAKDVYGEYAKLNF